MKNNKLLSVMLIVMVAITLISVVALVVIMRFTGDEKKEPTADEIVKYSVDVPEITTNLLDDSYIKIAFKIQADSKKAKEEAEKRDFQIKNIIIEELSEMKSEDFKGKQGKITLENRLKEQINQLMHEGQVEQVYITSFILQ
jgi:flagellar protein FliL